MRSVVRSLNGKDFQSQHPVVCLSFCIVKTKPFEFGTHSQRYHQKFRDKKVIERIKKD